MRLKGADVGWEIDGGNDRTTLGAESVAADDPQLGASRGERLNAGIGHIGLPEVDPAEGRVGVKCVDSWIPDPSPVEVENLERGKRCDRQEGGVTDLASAEVENSQFSECGEALDSLIGDLAAGEVEAKEGGLETVEQQEGLICRSFSD